MSVLKVSRFLLKVLLEARKRGANEIHLIDADEGVRGECRRVDLSSKTSKILSTLKGEDSLKKNIYNPMMSRMYSWSSNPKDLLAGVQGKDKRFLIAPLSDFRVLGDLTFKRTEDGKYQAIVLTNLIFSAIPSLLETLLLSETNKKLLSTGLGNKTGIIIASQAKQSNELDACASALAIRPDAAFFKNIESGEARRELIDTAKNALTVVGVRGRDPIELLLNVQGLFSDDRELKEEFNNLVHTSFVQGFVRKVCSACSRSTAVDKFTSQKVPPALIKYMGDTYMFGRGCAKCGQTSYSGTINLDSLLTVSPVIRDLLKREKPAEEITYVAYRDGTRSLLEDGITKIFQGKTSFEEVLKIAPNISEAFAVAADSAALRAPEGFDYKASVEAEEKVFEATETEPEPAAGGGNVLLIEDDPDQLRVLQMVFESSGFDVVTAENGQIGLERLESNSVDLVVCDIMMPVMNGLAFVKSLRSNSSYSHIPVLMLTAVENSDAEFKLLSEGADDYCEKNVKKKILLKRVERLMARRKKEPNPLGHLLGD